MAHELLHHDPPPPPYGVRIVDRDGDRLLVSDEGDSELVFGSQGSGRHVGILVTLDDAKALRDFLDGWIVRQS